MNINDDVKVKLTEYGEKVLHKCLAENYGHDADIILSYRQKGEFYQFQMWDFMSMFGPYMYMGGDQVFVDNEIEII